MNQTQKSPEELRILAAQVEAHLSPEFRAQLLEADLALANALRELVEVQRARKAGNRLEAFEAGSLKIRLTLYPDKIARPGSDPSFVGANSRSGRTFSARAWIGPNSSFINLELSIA